MENTTTLSPSLLLSPAISSIAFKLKTRSRERAGVLCSLDTDTEYLIVRSNVRSSLFYHVSQNLDLLVREPLLPLFKDTLNKFHPTPLAISKWLPRILEQAA